MSNILTIGAGVMSSAISIPASDNGHNVKILGTEFDNNIIKHINKNHSHPLFKNKFNNNVSALYLENLNQQLIDSSDLIIVGVSSLGIDWFIKKMKNFNISNKNFLLVTKGLYINKDNQIDILPNKIINTLENINLVAVVGPCKAIELSEKVPTHICFTSKDINLANKISNFFKNDYYFISISDDLIGVEFCSAIKNVYAIAVGLSQTLYGLNDLKNPESAIFSQSLLEMSKFVNQFGGRSASTYGLAGLGDLFVTSSNGRNKLLGQLLGKKIPYKIIMNKELKDSTVEGAILLKDNYKILTKYFDNNTLNKNDYPLLNALINTICFDKQIEIPWKIFES